ncbi:nuclear transcription factor Y subunit B-6-like [Lycium barbarum]|uniref:nuclear transcription factor Y subunit B-6-like n=1 Tax=Lycium barbarum TaxID=112863 RepID=UPI00293E3DF6|nr:nuclear transcription factor Y subunit B-6-like [Lycium barbarum]
MDLGGGNGSGGFHSYRRLPKTTSSDGNMNLAAQLNQVTTTTNNNNSNNNINVSSTNDSECTVREQDRFMPIANVIRIIRKILPPHAKISDDAKETIQECVSEFISFVTSEANDRCQREQRKTIMAEDMLWAMSKLGFDDYIEPLTLYLHRYRECDGGDRSSLRGELLLMKPRGVVVDPAASSSIANNMAPINYPLPPNFTMAYHHGYFAYGHMSNGYMQSDDDVASNSQSNSEANDVNHVESIRSKV